MMSMITVMLIIPLIAALLIFLSRKAPQYSKYIALIASVLTLGLSLYAWGQYDMAAAGFQLGQTNEWFPAFGVSFAVGLDGLSLPLFVLTTLLCALVVFFSWDVEERAPFYFGLLMVLETGVLGVFSSLDFFLFYIFWEIVLIPMFFMIGIWGGPRKSYASMKFLIYTHVASLIMLLGIGAMYFKAAGILGHFTFSIPELLTVGFPVEFQLLVFPALLFAFCVKLPVVPVHTWLPDAHVEAPTGGSVLLAGVLLKMGGYGLIRIAYMMNPEGAQHYTTLIVVLAMLSIVYGAYAALKQDDLKKMIAYSSISHMGFVLIGVASFTYFGIKGAIFQMVGHGLISAVLFMACGTIQHRADTRLISKLGGLYKKMPVGMTLFVLAIFASMGIPGFMGFVGEFSVMIGVIEAFKWVILLVGLGIIIAVGYYLWALQRFAFGDLPEYLKDIKDVHYYEAVPMLILVALIIYFGLQPNLLMNIIEAPTQALLALL